MRTVGKKTAFAVAAAMVSVALSGCLPQAGAPIGQAPPTGNPPPGQPETGENQSGDPAKESAGPSEKETGQVSPDKSADKSASKKKKPSKTEVIEDDEGVINPCRSGNLAGKLESSEYRGQGQGYGYVRLTNTGPEPCMLEGYPEIQMSTADNTEIPTRVMNNQQPGPKPIIVEPKEEAGFSMVWWTTPYRGTDKGCGQAPEYLSVQRARERDAQPPRFPVNVTNPLHPCQDGTLHVSAFEDAVAGD